MAEDGGVISHSAEVVVGDGVRLPPPWNVLLIARLAQHQEQEQELQR